jgi:hypothetical protein
MTDQFDQYTQLAQTETQLHRLFCAKYEAENPKPEKPSVASIKKVGFDFYLMLLVTIAAIIMTAMRTASIFFRAAALDGEAPFFTATQAVASMIAIEGALVVYALMRARDAKKVSDVWMAVGIGLTLVISVFAGLAQSITLVENLSSVLSQYFTYFLALVLGAGGSVVAYIDGHVTGQRLAKVNIDYQQSLKDFDIEMSQYAEAMNLAWKHSDEYKVARSGIKGIAQDVQKVFKALNIEHVERPRRNSAGATDRVVKFLNETYDATGEVPGVREISRELDVSVGTASSARRDWLDKFDPFKGAQ